VREIKEKDCFIALDPAKAMEEASNSNEHKKDYELPDGQVVQINKSRFMGPEALFFPDQIVQGSEV